MYENEYEELVTQYQKNIKIFFKFLSPENVELYFKLKILERKAKGLTDSENEECSSSEDDRDE